MDFTGFMAAFALAAFWLNTLLIAAAGWSEAAALLRARASHLASGTGDGIRSEHLASGTGAGGGPGSRDLAFRTGARRGVVTAAAGPDGALAVWRVVQVGRSNGKGPILFHDRGQSAEVFGGTVALADGGSVELAPGTAAELWIGGAARRAALRPDAGAFAAALPAASRAAGWERTIEAPLRVGQTIWLAGQVDAGLVLADADPRAWRSRVELRTAALVLGVLVVAGACTVACLWPPVFGTVSKLGAFAALVAFNLFQLFGKLHRDAIQPPPATVIDGAWPRP